MSFFENLATRHTHAEMMVTTLYTIVGYEMSDAKDLLACLRGNMQWAPITGTAGIGAVLNGVAVTAGLGNNLLKEEGMPVQEI